MSPILLAPIYFAVGLSSDFLIAKYYLCLSRRHRARASGLAVAIDLLGYIVTATLVLNRDFPSAIAFALGTGAGTWLALSKKDEGETDEQGKPKDSNRQIGAVHIG